MFLLHWHRLITIILYLVLIINARQHAVRSIGAKFNMCGNNLGMTMTSRMKGARCKSLASPPRIRIEGYLFLMALSRPKGSEMKKQSPAIIMIEAPEVRLNE